jgi:AcrR family transcriptional regulator
VSPSREGARGHRAAAGQGDRLRDELLDAAEAELAAKGSFAQVSLRQVARRAGVSATAVYLHFADRDELLLAACQRRMRQLVDAITAARAGADGAAAQLRACGTAYVRFGLDHPEHYRLMFGGALPMDLVLDRLPPEELVGLRALEVIAEVVAAGTAEGTFRAVDPAACALSLWAVVHGLVGVIDHGTDQPLDADALVAATLDLVLDGLRAAEAPLG